MDRPVPSEEKLLKLIRKKAGTPVQGAAHLGKQGDLAFSNLQALWGTSTRGVDGLNLINRVLIVVSVVLCGYIIIKGLFGSLPVQDRDPLEAEVSVPSQGEEPVVESPVIEPLQYDQYSKDFENRDLFNTSLYAPGPIGAVPVENTQAAPPAVNPLQNLKLVGIVLDEMPQAVIEDVYAKQTFFLHLGEEANGVTVQNIEESKVKVLYQGQSVELSLTPPIK